MGLFGKTENLKIEKKENVVAWEVKLEKGVSYNLQIESGLQCVLFRNGVKAESKYATTEKIVLKDKEGYTKIVVVNINNITPIRCGCGNVPFKDWEINCDTTVGMNGICEIKILNPSQFIDLFEDLTNVTNEKIEDTFRKNFANVLAMKLTADLKKYGRDVDKERLAMGDPIRDYLNQSLAKYGIKAETFTVNGIKFADDYLQAREAYFKKKEEERNRRREKLEQEEQRETELNTLERLSRMSNSNKSEEKAEFVYCPNCGFKNEKKTAYCKQCGTKLN